MALAPRPKLLLLDEPTGGMSPEERRVTGELLMPCHEYCGLGHSEMWATVQVLPENQFKPDQDGRVSCEQR